MSTRPPHSWAQQALWPDEDLRLYRLDCDIAPNSEVHTKITAMLAGFGLDLIAWKFETAANSHCARSDADGGHVSCPVLNLMLRQTKGLVALGLQDEQGNWDDSWPLTGPIRDALNEVLAENGLTAGYQSPAMFVFAQSWESRAYHRLGHMLKPRIAELVTALLPRRNPWVLMLGKPKPVSVYFGSYWGKEPGIKGQFNLLFSDEAAMRQAWPFRLDLRIRVSEEMCKADRFGFCENHAVGLELYYVGMQNLPPLYRED